MVEGHFSEKGMKLRDTGVINTGFVVTVVKARVRGGSAFLTLSPVVDEIGATQDGGDWGGLLWQLEDR